MGPELPYRLPRPSGAKLGSGLGAQGPDWCWLHPRHAGMQSHPGDVGHLVSRRRAESVSVV